MLDPNKERNDRILSEFKSKMLQQMNESLVHKSGGGSMFESQPYLESSRVRDRTG